jgi:hypothetical protein
VLDGRDDDAVWQLAPRISAFRQFAPRIDTVPSLKTEFRVAYDDRNLFVFVRMFDPHPDSILHALTRRDVRGPSDQIKLLIVERHLGRSDARRFARVDRRVPHPALAAPVRASRQQHLRLRCLARHRALQRTGRLASLSAEQDWIGLAARPAHWPRRAGQ